MTQPDDLIKERRITLSVEHTAQLEMAYEHLSRVEGCKVEYHPSPNSLQVTYNLEILTLEALEQSLTQAGFGLDQSLIHTIERYVIHYCEDTKRHNMAIPTHPTKKNQKEAFITAYQQEEHGDHDDTPPELRDYK